MADVKKEVVAVNRGQNGGNLVLLALQPQRYFKIDRSFRELYTCCDDDDERRFRAIASNELRSHCRRSGIWADRRFFMEE